MAKKDNKDNKKKEQDIVMVKRTDRGDITLPYDRPIAERLVAKGLGKIVKVSVTAEEKPKETKNPPGPKMTDPKENKPTGDSGTDAGKKSDIF